MGLGICLGGDLSEQQHQHRHHRSGNPHRSCVQVAGEHHRGQGGGKNVDHVVADEDGGQCVVKAVGDLQRPDCPLIALCRIVFQPDLVDAGKGHFTAGKHCGHHKQYQDDDNICHEILLYFSGFTCQMRTIIIISYLSQIIKGIAPAEPVNPDGETDFSVLHRKCAIDLCGVKRFLYILPGAPGGKQGLQKRRQNVMI